MRIVYAALGVNEFPKPWEKPKIAGFGSKTVPGSRPSKNDQLRASKNNKKRAKEKKSATDKAQPQKSPPHPEDKLDSQELRDAIELSKSDGAGTSKFVDLQQHDIEEEKALREAIWQSLADTSNRTTALPNIFTCFEEGNYILTQDEAEKLRETLIALSQDTRVVVSLHEAITVFKQERLQRDESLSAQEEEREKSFKRGIGKVKEKPRAYCASKTTLHHTRRA